MRILWRERSCRDNVNREKIVETSRSERTFSELIIVTCVSVGDVAMPNIVRVLNTLLSNKCTHI